MKYKKPPIPILCCGINDCLTMANWQELGIDAIACKLEDLLFKPGMDILFKEKDLSSYLNWKGTLVLDARLPESKTPDSYTLYSPYDGSELILSQENILKLIDHLNPQHVIWTDNTDEIPFSLTNKPIEDALNGIVYTHSGEMDLKSLDHARIFEVIDSSCDCATCNQLLTQAYLHHLLKNTPLLAERFLSMHNFFWILKNL